MHISRTSGVVVVKAVAGDVVVTGGVVMAGGVFVSCGAGLGDGGSVGEGVDGALYEIEPLGLAGGVV